ncbi:helix-turn-helix domain-containing protein [Escherichia coli]
MEQTTTHDSFDYYKYGSRLIRVDEKQHHYRDITPERSRLDTNSIRALFPNGFEFLATFDISVDNDEIIRLYNSFKPTIRTMRSTTGFRLDDETRDLIYKHIEAGTSFREIARKTGCNVSTISRMAK